MAGIQDPLTELPPPSRLDFEELGNFTLDASSAPPPAFISWDANVEFETPLRPRLLFIASSPSGLHLISHLPEKRLLGSVVLPAEDQSDEGSSKGSLSDDGNIKGRSVYDARNPRKQSVHTCNVYALDGEHASVIMVAVQTPIAEERANTWARAVLEAIAADRVMVVTMLQREHYRGKLSADDEVIFRLETDALRLEKLGKEEATMGHDDDVPYFPSGSIVSGFPAAVLTRCQLLGLKGRLLLSWPESRSSAPSLLVTILNRFPDIQCLDFSSSLQVPFKGKSVSDLEIYM
ncbi:hypothetical protein GOP47_0007903 [Adiantum capillus-veneris]|uniref:Proteasome assembly chaperone 1 n=1 Tax=Adiantum capillus-veneris TaxID=13818 RepID=A0A9D4V1Y2_ADICA|nr:hypothetical protein GOP47_0007903 [Adiantum capillus-veneris]